MEEALKSLKTDVVTCKYLEDSLRGKSTTDSKPRKTRTAGRSRDAPLIQYSCEPRTVSSILDDVITSCRTIRKRSREETGEGDDLSDASLSQYTRFTKEIALKPYQQFLHYVPRLVNVVTLAEALPVPGSGVTLPLDLKAIASRCKGAFYAPRRFAAVQLAFSNPRCRILIFHTGRLVGTGTSGTMAARLAIARAQRQLAVEADVHLHIRNFNVINTVGASSLRATLNCDAFASAHSSESHFDLSSFVGLAWRPANEALCCEIYSTGRANLPGSVAERQLLDSFSRMLPELLRFSSSAHLLEHIPEELQKHHRVSTSSKTNVAKVSYAPQRSKSVTGGGGIWEGWSDGAASSGLHAALEAEETDDLDLDGLGL